MAGLLRAQQGHGLVTGVGMHLTKHTYAIWSTDPGGTLGDAAPVFTADPVKIVALYDGPATVAGYTVTHGRDGAPEKGILVVDLPDGGRAHAHVLEAELLADAMSRELVGRRVRLAADGKVNVARW
jgi:acetyl-CoA C-acetyltransferase